MFLFFRARRSATKVPEAGGAEDARLATDTSRQRLAYHVRDRRSIITVTKSVRDAKANISQGESVCLKRFLPFPLPLWGVRVRVRVRGFRKVDVVH